MGITPQAAAREAAKAKRRQAMSDEKLLKVVNGLIEAMEPGWVVFINGVTTFDQQEPWLSEEDRGDQRSCKKGCQTVTFGSSHHPLQKNGE